MSVPIPSPIRPSRFRLSLIALAAFAAWPMTGFGQSEPERELAAVRERIGSLEQRLEEQVGRRDDGVAALRRLEREIAATQTVLRSLETQAAEQERERARLAGEERAARGRLDAEQSALAEQVRMSYMTGQQEVFKLMLSQESPADLGRMLTYYDYLNRARGERIETVDSELVALAALTEASLGVQRELERLRTARAAELETLGRSRDERQTLIAGLEVSIREAGSEIEQLRAEEQRLTELVTELSEILAGFPVESEAPFGELKGELSWPLDGRIVADFGELREGGPLRWNGVLLQAEAGTVVRAVYHGRVAFSEWFRGLGLLLIIDHGDGYMSLYGHNEALLREPGDWVAPGESVALVGDTGGQAGPSLYFEIRRHGDPQNPHAWVP